MTIYITTFDPETKDAEGHSTDSGFASIAEVLEVMGAEWISCSPRLVIYPGVAFSDYRFV